MLHKHFHPLHSSTRKYIEMYDLLVCINNLNEEKIPGIVLYNLLNKFNLNLWLNNKKPKLSERTQIINLIINALSNIQTQDNDTGTRQVNIYFGLHWAVGSPFYFPYPIGRKVMYFLLSLSYRKESCCVF
jgi:hypothetical protein